VFIRLLVFKTELNFMTFPTEPKKVPFYYKFCEALFSGIIFKCS